MVHLAVEIKELKLKNPVMTASGTFGYGVEFEDFIDINRLGGIVVKGTTGSRREGNPYPRMAETPAGMLNAVGLQNKGVDVFINDIYPNIRHYQTNMIVNVSGSTIEEYVTVAEKINALDDIPAIELNISCPNVKEGGMAFGTSCESAYKVVEAVRKAYHKTLIVKLSPNVSNIAEIAMAVEAAGADSVSLINTLLGMAIDANTQKPVLSTITGGLSGPAVKPIALRM
jgi:dihydroorotate dehydrogenase (NAD+) catalytic subunit